MSEFAKPSAPTQPKGIALLAVPKKKVAKRDRSQEGNVKEEGGQDEQNQPKEAAPSTSTSRIPGQRINRQQTINEQRREQALFLSSSLGGGVNAEEGFAFSFGDVDGDAFGAAEKKEEQVGAEGSSTLAESMFGSAAAAIDSAVPSRRILSAEELRTVRLNLLRDPTTTLVSRDDSKQSEGAASLPPPFAVEVLRFDPSTEASRQLFASCCAGTSEVKKKNKKKETKAQRKQRRAQQKQKEKRLADMYQRLDFGYCKYHNKKQQQKKQRDAVVVADDDPAVAFVSSVKGYSLLYRKKLRNALRRSVMNEAPRRAVTMKKGKRKTHGKKAKLPLRIPSADPTPKDKKEEVKPNVNNE